MIVNKMTKSNKDELFVSPTFMSGIIIEGLLTPAYESGSDNKPCI